jgi:hypothetical protein
LPDQSAMPSAGTATAAGAREIPGQDDALAAMLFPQLARLRMHTVADAGEAVVISASCRAESACCPRCGQESSRVHGGIRGWWPTARPAAARC